VINLDKKTREKYNAIAQECQEYEPIAAARNLSMAYGEDEVEDAGCDSCIHFNDGECDIYKREAEETY